MSSLSYPNKIRNIYSKLVFKGSDGNLYIDNGSADILIQNLPIQGVTASTTAPTSGIDEGDIWYDTDDDKTYIRKDSSWVELFGTDSIIDGGTWT